MLAHTKKHLIKHDGIVIIIHHGGATYSIPKKVAEKYRVENDTVSPDSVFSSVNKKYTKPGALLRGIRIREELTQSLLAKKIGVTQSDISQMEIGVRKIGREIAKRIEKLFGVNYRSFLE